VVVLGLASALLWGSGDFGGGLVTRRAPVLAVVAVTQAVGAIAALVLAIARGEPFPVPSDVGLAILAAFGGLVGITCLYRGLAVGRMGVVAPTTGVLSAVVPVVVGFALEGVPDPAAILGILAAIVAVILVTGAPSADPGRPSGARWALAAGLSIGLFNVCIGQLSGTTALGPLVLLRFVQAVILVTVILVTRRAWRMPRDIPPKLVAIGLLDMGGNAAFILATQAGALAIAAVLASLYPVVTVLLAIVLLREHVTRGHVAGIALTVLAIALIAAGAA
jgi:drug/metabolite transporter (DMT)-like permease